MSNQSAPPPGTFREFSFPIQSGLDHPLRGMPTPLPLDDRPRCSFTVCRRPWIVDAPSCDTVRVHHDCVELGEVVSASLRADLARDSRKVELAGRLAAGFVFRLKCIASDEEGDAFAAAPEPIEIYVVHRDVDFEFGEVLTVTRCFRQAVGSVLAEWPCATVIDSKDDVVVCVERPDSGDSVTLTISRWIV